MLEYIKDCLQEKLCSDFLFGHFRISCPFYRSLVGTAWNACVVCQQHGHRSTLVRVTNHAVKTDSELNISDAWRRFFRVYCWFAQERTQSYVSVFTTNCFYVCFTPLHFSFSPANHKLADQAAFGSFGLIKNAWGGIFGLLKKGIKETRYKNSWIVSVEYRYTN